MLTSGAIPTIGVTCRTTASGFTARLPGACLEAPRSGPRPEPAGLAIDEGLQGFPPKVYQVARQEGWGRLSPDWRPTADGRREEIDRDMQKAAGRFSQIARTRAARANGARRLAIRLMPPFPRLSRPDTASTWAAEGLGGAEPRRAEAGGRRRRFRRRWRPGPLAHHHDAGGHVDGFLHIVGHEDDGGASHRPRAPARRRPRRGGVISSRAGRRARRGAGASAR